MDPTDIGLFRLAERRLAWVDGRQSLLSQNVANANTPGYVARDVAPFAASLSAASAGLATTDPAHLGGAGRDGVAPVRTRPHERSPDGNAVALEEQLGRIADTAATQAVTVNLYRKYANLFRTVLGRTG